MALYDFTNQNIEDTYHRIVQITGSQFYDGTGSLIDSFSGSFTGSFSGVISNAISSSYAATASWAVNVNSASLAISSSYSNTSITASYVKNAISSSYAYVAETANIASQINGFSSASIDDINIGTVPASVYQMIVNSENLEKSKMSTVNIFNYLNFT